MAFFLTAMPSLAAACPNCFGTGPNHRGLIVAAVFLAPLPFVAMGLVFWRLRKDEDGDEAAQRGR